LYVGVIVMWVCTWTWACVWVRARIVCAYVVRAHKM
jgi:hypothetical protein